MSLVVDTREKWDTQAAIRAAVPDASLLALSCADVAIFDTDGCSLGIERKEVGDLLSSIGSGRLDSQLARMVDLYTHRILLVEGTMRMGKSGKVILARRATGWTHASVQMKLLSIQRAYQARLIWTAGTEETADVLRVLAARAEKGCVAPSGKGE